METIQSQSHILLAKPLLPIDLVINKDNKIYFETYKLCGDYYTSSVFQKLDIHVEDAQIFLP